MTTSASGNPSFGAPVPEGKAKLPSNVVSLIGRLVTLEPRHPCHFDDLFDVLGGEANARLWNYIPYGPYITEEEFRAEFDSRGRVTPNSFFYTVINNASRKAVGSLALMNIDTTNRTVEVGSVLFSFELQRTVMATEVMYLLACLVFDTLGYRRYEWKCDNLNWPSRNAALRLGFRFEGVFRQHWIVKGRNRDSTWYSMLDGEWPTVKLGFERWLDERNFDAEGRQRESLAALRDAVAS